MVTWQQFLNRHLNAHKYDFGHVLVVGGSPGMVGAPLLTAMAALRMGAGLVTIASLPEVIDKLEGRIPEVMTERIIDYSPVSLHAYITGHKVNAIVIGPGQDHTWQAFDRTFLRELMLPVVIDGGALAAYQGYLSELASLAMSNHRIVITPHAGEYGKLAGEPVPDDPNRRISLAREFAHDHHVTVVLKGHGTVVATSAPRPYQNDTGNPGMATAGSGDVLSGVVGALLAQGLSVREAAERGVHVHGLAGDIAAEQRTQPGMIASDIIDCLPEALRREV